MMGGLCLGAMRLQRGQGFWATEGTGYGWLAEEDRTEKKKRKREEEGICRGGFFAFWRQLSRGVFWRNRRKTERK